MTILTCMLVFNLIYDRLDALEMKIPVLTTFVDRVIYQVRIIGEPPRGPTHETNRGMAFTPRIRPASRARPVQMPGLKDLRQLRCRPPHLARRMTQIGGGGDGDFPVFRDDGQNSAR